MSREPCEFCGASGQDAYLNDCEYCFGSGWETMTPTFKNNKNARKLAEQAIAKVFGEKGKAKS